jgi:mannose-1-phosphate guanylyltransferase
MKKLENTYVLILAGGIGSRFWPTSRESRPKQFIDILGTGKTLLQDAYARNLAFTEEENIFIITNADYAPLIKEQIPTISNNQIMGEPHGKNTAACIAYAAYKIAEQDPDGIIIVAPSDQLILDREQLNTQIETAYNFARNNDALITLGIKPHRPDTGYGYIQFDEREVGAGVNKVKTFTEKPPLELAQKFLESGDFLWNAGMFIWSVNSILSALNEHLPEMSMAFAEGKGAYNTAIEREHIDRIYSQINSISIDNGLLEKADNVYVLPSDFGWSDLGTWRSVMDHTEPINGNSSLNAIVHNIDSSRNLVVTEDEKLVVLKDLNGYFVIDTKDALLICKTDQEQEIKRISTEVKKKFKGKYS